MHEAYLHQMENVNWTQMSYPAWEKNVLDLLRLPFQSDTDPGLPVRRKILRKAFNALHPAAAAAVLSRLSKSSIPTDELAKGFHTLHTATRNELEAILRDRLRGLSQIVPRQADREPKLPAKAPQFSDFRFPPERLVYTCNCGWIDKEHATPEGMSDITGAQSLWRQIKSEVGRGGWLKRDDEFRVSFRQEMGPKGIRWAAGVTRDFWVRKGLSIPQKEAVALAIFLEVSYQFEELQGSRPWVWKTNSSFSVEDLVSDLVGFYEEVRNVDWRKECKPVSDEAAWKILSDYGSLGEMKNVFLYPRFFPCDECKETPRFPSIYHDITPAEKGDWFHD